jgi:SAM-dependent methyltransferase
VAGVLTSPHGHEARWAPLGRALLDFHRGATTARITVGTDLWHDEVTAVEEYYRPDRQPLPELEKTALDLCRGRTLDLGAGAGRHALELQRRGLEVTAVDVLREAVEVMRQRGVVDARRGTLDDLAGERFDTVVLLMHGIGLVGTLRGLDHFLRQTVDHLDEGGRIIFDSADLGLVMPERFGDGLEEWRAGGIYPGEVEYRLSYGELEGEPYPWLFIDPLTLVDRAKAADLGVEIVARGERGSYLAILQRRLAR